VLRACIINPWTTPEDLECLVVLVRDLGASELLKQLFGEAGEHACTAVGVNTLPRDASVEIEIVFEAK